MERAYRAVFLIALLLGILLLIPLDRVTADGRLIEIIADHDNQFKVPGQKKAVITLKAGEPSCCGSRREEGASGEKMGWCTASPSLASKTKAGTCF